MLFNDENRRLANIAGYEPTDTNRHNINIVCYPHPRGCACLGLFEEERQTYTSSMEDCVLSYG